MNEKERNHRRAFGQNFLIDDSVIAQLCEDVPVLKEDGIIEIGPGRGALSSLLIKSCYKFMAIEKDPKCLEFLKSKSLFEKAEFIEADASRVDLKSVFTPFKGIENIHLVGNLPYNMTGPILKHFLPVLGKFKTCQFMVQYEVAKRMVADPGSKNFGSLSVMVQNYSRAKLLRKVPPDAFRPKPNVFSATVSLWPHPSPINDSPLFPIYVKQSFSQKRKKLSNCLGPLLPKAQILESLKKLDLSPDIRAEQLGVKEHNQLFHLLVPTLEKVFNKESD